MIPIQLVSHLNQAAEPYLVPILSLKCSPLLGLIALASIASAQAPDAADKDYSDELPRVAAKSPSEALAELEVLPGFEVQLIAAEPLVVDPVAFAFDARGRLFVVEMRDYSEQATEHLGRVALLEDTDGDGVMDRRFTFVDGLSWPTAIWPWRDGVLVAEPPRITWYRDTDGDSQSDLSEDWFTGFARSNVQGLVNSLRWGIDGKIHGATSSSGADIQALADPTTDATMALGRRDFAIDPLNKSLHPEGGGGQHGLSFNRWGDKFVTSNSDHLQQVIDLDGWLSRHASDVPMPSTRRSIATDGPQAEVFRASPIEPWRIVRTRLRVSGVAPGIVEGDGRAAGYFTGATGTWIAPHELGFGEPGFDTALVCDVGSNLVHRKRLTPHGLFWSGSRIDEETELLRSRDIWFRPVQLGDGPDGAIYVADMAREVIEHPLSLPPMIKQHLDLTSGRDRGRIWRLASRAAAPTTPRNLAERTSKELVAHLGHELPWQRLMASQLLIERGDAGLRGPLEQVVLSAGRAESRLLALHVAARLGECDEPMLRRAMADPHPRVMEGAIRLAGELGLADQLVGELGRAAQMDDAHTQLALAMVAADLDEASQWSLLPALIPRVTEPLVRAVIATAAAEQSWRLLEGTSDSAMAAGALADWLRLLLPTWGRQAASNQQLANWLRDQLNPENPLLARWLDGLCQMSSRAEADALLRLLPEADRVQLTAAIESALEDASRAEHLEWIALLPEATQGQWLSQSLTPSVADATQASVIRALAWANHPSLASALLESFSSLTPAIQREALRVLGSRGESLEQLATALEQGRVLRSQIAPEYRQQLLHARDADLAARFEKLLEGVSADRAAVIARYADQLDVTGDSVSTEAGRQVFQRVCAQCHQIDGTGQDVGPPLKQVADKSPGQLLETILDPNREIDPKYASYSALLDDGRVLSGIIRDESTSQIILAEAGGTAHTLPRSQIELLKSSGVSFMPVGLEEQVTTEQMSALIKFLRSSGK